MACPAAFSVWILKNVFFVYGDASVEPPPMLYSSSSSAHEEIMWISPVSMSIAM